MNGNCHFIFGAAVGSALVMNLGAVSAAIPQITNTPETATLLVLNVIKLVVLTPENLEKWNFSNKIRTI